MPAANPLLKNASSGVVAVVKLTDDVVTQPGAVPVVINEDTKGINATEPQTKPLEHSTVAGSAEKKVETSKSETLSADDEEAKALAEMKAEEAAKANDANKAGDIRPDETGNDVGAKPGEPQTKNEAVVLENGEQSPFDAENEDDTEKERPDDKGDGELPYRDGDDDDDYGGDPMVRNNNNIPEIKLPQDPEPTLDDDVPHKKVEIVDFEEDPDSNFFTYLCALMFLCIVLYILHQNRQKVLALFLEGRRGNRRGSRDRSRGGSKAAYSKLDCNLEEAIMSKKSLSGKSMDIIY